MAALAQPDLMETAIRSALAAIQLPDGIKLRRLDFKPDHDGDPSVYVVYSVAEGKPDEERAGEMVALDTETVRPISRLDLPVLTYVKYEAA